MILPPVGPCLPCGGDSGAVNPAPCPTGVVPGPQGDPGSAGSDGVGYNSFTVNTVEFVVPAVNDQVTIVVVYTNWIAVGQIVFIQSAGYYQVAAIDSITDVVITNLGYADNAIPTTTIAPYQPVVPSGIAGQTGDTGGGVTSVALSAPAIFTVTGSPITSSGTLSFSFAAGQAQNRVLASPDGMAGAISLRALVVGDIPSLPASQINSGELAIINGGTGQATAQTGFNALAPTTTLGDLIVRNGTDNVRQAVGADGTVLTADSSAATGVSWQNAASVVTNPTIQVTVATYSMLASDLIIGVNRAGAVAITLLPTPSNGRLVIIKDQSGAGATNIITVLASGGDSIQGSPTKVINTNSGYLSLYYSSVDATWYVIGSA